MLEQAYIFLDPDGSQGAGVIVIVQAPTGVVYASQVGGMQNEERSVEGFAIPNFHPAHLEALLNFFARYHGSPPDGRTTLWPPRHLDELNLILGRIPLWQTSREQDTPASLTLDRTRLQELTEGWIPVNTAYGPGILTHQNCD